MSILTADKLKDISDKIRFEKEKLFWEEVIQNCINQDALSGKISSIIYVNQNTICNEYKTTVPQIIDFSTTKGFQVFVNKIDHEKYQFVIRWNNPYYRDYR